jgi:hypothetical protein
VALHDRASLAARVCAVMHTCRDVRRCLSRCRRSGWSQTRRMTGQAIDTVTFTVPPTIGMKPVVPFYRILGFSTSLLFLLERMNMLGDGRVVTRRDGPSSSRAPRRFEGGRTL